MRMPARRLRVSLSLIALLASASASAAGARVLADTHPPSVPGRPAVVAVSSTSIGLRWRASRDDIGVSSYRVYVDGKAAGSTKVPSFAIRHPKCGNGYTVRVVAVDTAGNRSQAASVVARSGRCSDSAAACTRTIAGGLGAAILGASGGAVICLTSGSYGTGETSVDLKSVSKSSEVTVQPAPGADVVLAGVRFDAVSYIRFTGLGGRMKIDGLDLDPLEEQARYSNHLTFDHIVWTAAVNVRTHASDMALLFDHDVFDNLGPGIGEGRITIRGYDFPRDVGVTISNSHFAGGCSDGVDVIGDAYGTVIGPGNEFTDIHQSGCTAHVDPIQLYGSSHTTVTGNWFHDNGDGSGGMMTDSDDDYVTVTDNVFVCTCIYPHSIVVRGGDYWLIQHNTFAGGGAVRMDNSTGPNPTNNVVRDNVFTGAGGILNLCKCNWGTNDHNLNSDRPGAGEITGTPAFVGGAHPTTYAGYRLAARSPGKGAASDGRDVGIR